jgi:hypothetical protein
MQVGVERLRSIQPIHYSHKFTRETMGLAVNIHSSSRVSKHSGIPSLNVCMNCHKSIAEVSDTTATPEYSKAFMMQKSKSYIRLLDGMLPIKKYTGKMGLMIHLPSFVYIHSQHVNVAGVECQTCHGPVQEYEIQNFTLFGLVYRLSQKN